MSLQEDVQVCCSVVSDFLHLLQCRYASEVNFVT